MTLPLKYIVSAFGGSFLPEQDDRPRTQKEYAIVRHQDKYNRLFTFYLSLLNP